jgi:lambda family phage portal protein
MPNIADRIAGYFSSDAALKNAINRASLENLKRSSASMSYDVTGNGRRGFKTNGDASVKSISSNNLVVARKNMRELYRNNSIIKSAVDAKSYHTVGDGIRPSIRSDAKSKAKQNKVKQVQRLVSLWAGSIKADVYGMHNLFGQQFIGFKTMCSAGGVLIVRQRTLEAKSGLHLQIKMLEGDFLDHLRTVTLENGHEIINGVEVDGDEQVVAYWLFDRHPGDVSFFSRKKNISRRHSAENVIHMFDCERPGQLLGMPKGLASAIKAKNLEEFQDARLEQQKIAACFVGTVSTTQGIGNTGPAGDPLPSKAAPGQILRLGNNQTMDFNTPPTVSGQHDFITEELHQIASDWGITYQALVGDLTQVNFTSGRMGWLDMHRKINGDRNRIIIPLLLERIWGWLQEALEVHGLSARDLDCDWIPPRREMFDPTKEIGPLIKAIRAGLKPMQRALLEQGDNPDVIMDQYKEWNEQADARDLIFDTDPRRVSGAGNANPIPDDDEDENKDEKNEAA